MNEALETQIQPTVPQVAAQIQPNTEPVLATAVSESPSIDAIKELYVKQNRNCWLCEKISQKIGTDKLTEDDIWHFNACVLSWEHIHRKN